MGNSLNYIKTDEEFFGILKLISGEEIIGRIIVTDENGTTLAFIQDPALVHSYDTANSTGRPAVAVGLKRWMVFSNEDFYIVAEDKIMTVAPLSAEATQMYNFFVKQEMGPAKNEVKLTDEISEPSELNYKQGFIGTVEEYRKKLEDLFKG
tara:strand:- start:1798 stop:2250 length:453 start_codon:yes stop_codon:yes gene_type:complete